MKIHASEKSFESRILQAKTNASFEVQVRLTLPKEENLIKSLERMGLTGCNKSVANAMKKLSQDHPDLMYCDAILVSTVMNSNDDVFLPEDTWAARFTPINTPFNEDHVEHDIIGHIFDAYPVDKDQKLIESETAPDYFDIIASFVVYKSIFPKSAEDIATNGPIGKKFVSMQAVFNNFDYALVKNKETKIIARNDNTAFLTKYLRAYGGEGFFKDYKVGRVLRNFRFDGMGNVEKPGNPRSKYTEIENYSTATASEIQEITKSKTVIHITQGKIMTIETLEQANKVIADYMDMASKDKVEKETLASKLKEHADKVGELEKNFKAKSDDYDASSGKLALAETTIKDLTVKLADTESKFKASSDELGEIKSKAKSEARLAQLKEINLESTETLLKMEDVAFATIVEYAKKIKPSTTVIQTHEEIEKAKAEAQATLDKLNTQTTSNAATTTSGDTEVQTQKEELEKTAASLISAIRKTKKSKIDNK